MSYPYREPHAGRNHPWPGGGIGRAGDSRKHRHFYYRGARGDDSEERTYPRAEQAGEGAGTHRLLYRPGSYRWADRPEKKLTKLSLTKGAGVASRRWRRGAGKALPGIRRRGA